MRSMRGVEIMSLPGTAITMGHRETAHADQGCRTGEFLIEHGQKAQPGFIQRAIEFVIGHGISLSG